MARSGKDIVELFPRSVIKRFSDAEDYYRELRVYQAGLPMVPKLLRFGEREWIEAERIDGNPYLDADFGPDKAARLGTTLARFHLGWFSEDVCLCHWDNQPRNILSTDGGYFFIDFSESRLAPPEADISHLFLFWAADLPWEANPALWRAFLKAYQRTLPLEPDRWEEAFKQSLKRFTERRRKHSRPMHRVSSEDWETSLDLLHRLLA